jgi:hypothetical protein
MLVGGGRLLVSGQTRPEIVIFQMSFYDDATMSSF